MNNLFYSLEDGKYYTYPDGDEATGTQIREVIEANERSISKLQQETEKLKKQYCERTDCGGRIGNSKKVEELQRENKQLHEELEWAIGIVEHNRIIGEKNKEIHQLKEKLDCDLQWALKYEKQVGNWNKLKEYIKTEIPEDVFIDTEWFVSILDKMQELQGSDSNE